MQSDFLGGDIVEQLDLTSSHSRVPTEDAIPALRTAAAGGSPRRPRGAPASAQLAVHCRRPAHLRSTTPRLCGSCAAALVARRRSPARGSAHTPAATTCEAPRARGVVSTPERHSGRAMGAAFTRPTVIVFGSARARAYGVGQIQRTIGAAFGYNPEASTINRARAGRGGGCRCRFAVRARAGSAENTTVARQKKSSVHLLDPP